MLYLSGDAPAKRDVERSLSDESGGSGVIASENALNLLKNTNDFTDLQSMQRIVKTATAKVRYKCVFTWIWGHYTVG